ncbi:CaiB/BaiF CoA-transferase family protein [Mycolicibacterium sp. P9-22]|uniref:CaiB/BaiF CoA transferase family protein n=1 Tax=Mycolicibacterium sp. P9-22 TaxID=2024613 RepID=UPI0011EF4087|nr:CoA transferase [Mycolicibacterium sp. P9-22]KAA0109973.1 CoA transferase [Mycolicibacterium sp. P9-22]
MGAICQGLNVIEIGAGSAAASMAGMVLADAGARVIKVEPPEGDRLRATRPSGFLVWNRGKESVVCDLRVDAGRADLRALAADADVVLEGFEPGTTDRWGIGPDTLRSLNPQLVHCSFTGFGRTGPYAKLKGYDSLVAAKAGLWYRGAWGHRDGPIISPVAWGSYGCAMQGVSGILGALMVREKTGRGQVLDATLIAGLDALEYYVTTTVQLMAKRGDTPSADLRTLTGSSRYMVMVVTRDGHFIQTATLLPRQGWALNDVAELHDSASDPRFERLPMFDTADDAQAWEDQLLEAFRAKDLDYWLPRLEASPDVAFEVARTSEQGLDHPQIVHNGDSIVVQDPDVGPVRQVGPIGHFEHTPCQITRSAPAIGANNGPFVAQRRMYADAPAPVHPFAGKTIVEFGYFYALPYATSVAASLGARVIKIEDANGDPSRQSFGNEVGSSKTLLGKESISVDLRTDEGREVAHRIIARADAFVTSFRSGVADRLGLGYEELLAQNPQLLYVHATGYGTDGPYAERAQYANTAQTVAGSFGRQVGYWSQPSMNEGMSVIELQAIVLPRLNQVIDGDANAALGLTAALSLGLYAQQHTDKGQFLRTSMIAGNAWAYSDDFCAYEGKTPVPLCDDDYFGTSALDRAYESADGSWVYLTVTTATEFDDLAKALDNVELSGDDRFATAGARRVNDGALASLLAAAFRNQPADQWESLLSDVGVGCVAVNMNGQPPFIAFDPVLRETGLTVAYEHPVFGEMVRAAPPVSFSETPGRVAPPPLRGQHNHAVLAELGYTPEQIDGLETRSVVIPPG